MRQFVVAKLRAICDPTTDSPWIHAGGPITFVEVEQAAKEKRFAEFTKNRRLLQNRQYHIERIAYFTVHGWIRPLSLDVGIPSIGFFVSWPILDGNHRFFAAIVRGDELIRGEASGAVSEINRLCRRKKAA